VFSVTVNFASELSCVTLLYGHVASQVRLIWHLRKLYNAKKMQREVWKNFQWRYCIILC